MYARTYRETGHGEVANRGSWPYGEIIIISTYNNDMSDRRRCTSRLQHRRTLHHIKAVIFDV